jgi:undecaprenyl-diphosphatase
MSHLTYLQAVVIGLLQGVTELFPISSLGHSVLLPAVIGGSWASNLSMTREGSPYLAFLVAVHVATATALVVFYWRDWAVLIRALGTSVRHRRITTIHERRIWLLIVGTVPVGLVGLVAEHPLRTTLGAPLPAAAFLLLNGLVLLTVERLRRRRPGQASPRSHEFAAASVAAPASGVGSGFAGDGNSHLYRSAFTAEGDRAADGPDGDGTDARVAALSWRSALAVGSAQILALLPGVSRSGATIAAGLMRGLDHEDAASFAFLLATPVIAAAGLLKLPELAGATGRPILGQVLVGSLVAAAAAYVSLRWLTRWFTTHTLTPFAIYCVAAGGAGLAWFGLR